MPKTCRLMLARTLDPFKRVPYALSLVTKRIASEAT
jgi:hypothetical protein